MVKDQWQMERKLRTLAGIIGDWHTTDSDIRLLFGVRDIAKGDSLGEAISDLKWCHCEGGMLKVIYIVSFDC